MEDGVSRLQALAAVPPGGAQKKAKLRATRAERNRQANPSIANVMKPSRLFPKQLPRLINGGIAGQADPFGVEHQVLDRPRFGQIQLGCPSNTNAIRQAIRMVLSPSKGWNVGLRTSTRKRNSR